MPPQLHHVRCHEEYFEDENMITSCPMEHDEEPEDVDYYNGIRYECCGFHIYPVSSIEFTMKSPTNFLHDRTNALRVLL